LSQDIEPFLRDWEFRPDVLQVRVITGDGGDEKIQMRIDLGLIQMEFSGRPDGARPHGYESLLEYHEARAERAREESVPYALAADECAGLMREGLQYYHRYLSAFHLERFDVAARDTQRNLRLFTFVARHASRERDKLEFEQYRPYVLMMNSRALGAQVLKEGDHKGALSHIDAGIEAIRQFLREYGQEEREAKCSELQFLIRWRGEVERERPLGVLERLEQQLELSVDLEDYEEAARLRDQIRRLHGTKGL
jgi:hypothetical protein